MNSVLDTYSLQARLLPGVLATLPLMVTLAAWFPESYALATGVLGSVGIVGVTLFLAHVARASGRRLERRLYEEWGGKPTTLWLRHADANLDSRTKQRYRQCLETSVPSWTAPTADEEANDLASSDEKYETAARWLRERTRDKGKFPLVYSENVSYGFRRNLRGLKWPAIAIATTCFIGSALGVYLTSESRESASEAGLVASVISLASVVCWLTVVTKPWVRDAADGYARALLAACDQLST